MVEVCDKAKFKEYKINCPVGVLRDKRKKQEQNRVYTGRVQRRPDSLGSQFLKQWSSTELEKMSAKEGKDRKHENFKKVLIVPESQVGK